MNPGDKVYFIETGNVIKEGTIVKVANGFATIRYELIDPHYLEGGKGHISKPGGIRLRTSRLFEEKEQAEAFIKYKNETDANKRELLEKDKILNKFE